MKNFGRAALTLVFLSLPSSGALAAEGPLRDQAAQALRRATEFFRTKVSTQGGYLWRYSEDLSQRAGENAATDTMVWVQPPGTPTVGQAFLDAYGATGEPAYLDAAHDAASALVRGQLRSGGWYYSIEFDPQRRARYDYRTLADVGAGAAPKRRMNITTLDDNNTQSALRMLMRVDRALRSSDPMVHEAALYALDCLLKAQYCSG